MIQVTIEQDQSKQVRSFEMKGHADFAEHGKDLVCAGASAVSFGAVNAIMSLTNITPDIQQGQDGGFSKSLSRKTWIQERMSKYNYLYKQ